MAKFCTQCGAPVEEDSKFCTQCGAPLAAAPKAVEPVGQPAVTPPAPGNEHVAAPQETARPSQTLTAPQTTTSTPQTPQTPPAPQGTAQKAYRDIYSFDKPAAPTPTASAQRTAYVPVTGTQEQSIKDRYFSTTGRLNRKPYILRSILLSILAIICSALLDTATSILIIIGCIGVIACVISGIMVTVRRLHDLNMSGWWYLLLWIPFVNFIFSLVLLFKKGTDGPNSYGPDPLA